MTFGARGGEGYEMRDDARGMGVRGGGGYLGTWVTAGLPGRRAAPEG